MKDSDNVFRLLSILCRKPWVSQRELSKELNLSLGYINHIMKVCISEGLVTVTDYIHLKRKAYVYKLTSQGLVSMVSLAGSYLKRLKEVRTSIDKEIKIMEKEFDRMALAIESSLK